jgi:hypothetical protein
MAVMPLSLVFVGYVTVVHCNIFIMLLYRDCLLFLWYHRMITFNNVCLKYVEVSFYNGTVRMHHYDLHWAPFFLSDVVLYCTQWRDPFQLYLTSSSRFWSSESTLPLPLALHYSSLCLVFTLVLMGRSISLWLELLPVLCPQYSYRLTVSLHLKCYLKLTMTSRCYCFTITWMRCFCSFPSSFSSKKT